METKKRRYYKLQEKVWIKELKMVGTVKSLDVQPEKNIYKATVETTEEKGKTIIKTVRDYDLWQLDKLKDKKTSQPLILFARVRESAKIPSKREEDGAYDIYANFEGDELLVPKVGFNEDEEFIFSDNHPLIPTGIASSVSADWRICLKNERGSVGKYKVLVLSGLIDSGYRGEWFVNLAPLTKDLVISKTYDFPLKDDGTQKPVELSDKVIYPYSLAIAQAKLEPSPNAKVKEISYEELKAIPSQRGTGALGSSNK